MSKVPDARPFATYAVGGDRLVLDSPVAFVHTMLHGNSRVAIVERNSYNPDAVNASWESFMPAVVLKIKELRGWDYDTYPVLLAPMSVDYPHEKIKWGKDPFSGAPTFGAATVPVPSVDVDRMVRALRDISPKQEPILDADLCKYQAFDHDLE